MAWLRAALTTLRWNVLRSAPGPDRLARLLSAAAAPGRPHELVGEQAAVDAYVQAGRHPAAPAASLRHRLRTAISRAIAFKVMVVLAALSVGSAAVAAQTGQLPPEAQQAVHDLFPAWGVRPPPAVPDPVPSRSSGPTPRWQVSARPTSQPVEVPGTHRVEPHPSRPTARPSSPPAAPAPSPHELQRMCRLYLGHRQRPDIVHVEASDLRALGLAAGGAGHVPRYCQRLLGVDEDPSPPPSRAPAPTRTPDRKRPAPRPSPTGRPTADAESPGAGR
jgi:hypothetical protein